MSTPTTTDGPARAGDWVRNENLIYSTGSRVPDLTIYYRLYENDTTLSIDGIDWPGVLLYLTATMARFELSYDVYVGERGHAGHGSRCEFPSDPDTWDKLRRMHDYIRQHPEEFRPRPPLGFDRVHNLTVLMPNDGCGLLCAPAEVLLDLGVNMRYIRAERDIIGEVSGGHAVRIFAQLESPQVSDRVIVDEIRRVCPEAKVSARQVWQVEEPPATAALRAFQS